MMLNNRKGSHASGPSARQFGLTFRFFGYCKMPSFFFRSCKYGYRLRIIKDGVTLFSDCALFHDLPGLYSYFSYAFIIKH